MNVPELYDDKKERLNMYPHLLNNEEERLDGSHLLHELRRKLMEARSKTHNHQYRNRGVLCKSQFGNKAAKQLGNKQLAKRRASGRKHKVRAQKGEIVHKRHTKRLI